MTARVTISVHPGLWYPAVEEANLIQVPSGESSWEIGYALRNLTSRGEMVVVVTDVTGGGEIYHRTFSIGGDGAILTFDLARFHREESLNFELFAAPGTPAAGNARGILDEREAALVRVESLIGRPLGRRVSLFFYPDEETKRRETGHSGAGWAVNDVLVEIYSAETRLDPYHELTHLVAQRLGDPPALFDEGLAVHSTERFAGNAMDSFDAPGLSVDDAVRRNIDAGRYVPLRRMFGFTEIGSPGTEGLTSYPQAGSFVGWLAAQFGDDRLRQAYSRLGNSSDEATQGRNLSTFREIFGLSIEEAERRWRRHLGRPLSR